MKMMPPIVGVPRLTWWLFGPSSRMNWPHPMRVNSRMNSGVRNSVKASDNAPAVSRALTRTILQIGRRAGGSSVLRRRSCEPFSQSVAEQAETRRVRRFHQHGVARPGDRGHEVERLVGGLDVGGLAVP